MGIVQRWRRALAAGIVLGAATAMPALVAQPAAAAPSERTGRIVRADGRPVPNLPVQLVVGYPGNGIGFCSFDGSCKTTDTVKGTTDGAGRYSLAVPSTGTSERNEHTIIASSGGTDVSVSVPATREGTPDLALWNPKVTVVVNPETGVLTPQFAPPLALAPGLKATGPPSDQLSVSSGPATLREVEDQVAKVRASTEVRTADATFGGVLQAAFKGGLVPASRGKPCTIVRTDGSKARSCKATDGKLDVPVEQPCPDPGKSTDDPFDDDFFTRDPGAPARSGPACGLDASIVVDMGKAVAIDELRRDGQPLIGFATSLDGRTWSAWDPSSRATARYVRSTFDTFGTNPAEISVWVAAPPPPVSTVPTTIQTAETTTVEALPTTTPTVPTTTTAPSEVAAPRAALPVRARPVGLAMLATALLLAVAGAAAAKAKPRRALLAGAATGSATEAPLATVEELAEPERQWTPFDDLPASPPSPWASDEPSPWR